MRLFHTILLACLATMASASSSPSRPNLKIQPKEPPKRFPYSPPRDNHKVCTVLPGKADVGPSILAAARKCNHGGTVYFPAGFTYTVASRLDLTFLENIDFAILGTIVFKDDLAYWQKNAFQYSYQSASFFWRFGGHDVNIYGLGTGVIDGLGNSWWSAWQANSSVARPILLGTDGLTVIP